MPPLMPPLKTTLYTLPALVHSHKHPSAYLVSFNSCFTALSSASSCEDSSSCTDTCTAEERHDSDEAAIGNVHVRVESMAYRCYMYLGKGSVKTLSFHSSVNMHTHTHACTPPPPTHTHPHHTHTLLLRLATVSSIRASLSAN